MDYTRIKDYLLSLEAEEDSFLEALRDRAELGNVPIIRKETESLLRTLTVLKRPRKILEIGTAVGYSAIVMEKAMGGFCPVITVESYEKRIPEALKNIRDAGFQGVISLLFEDAGEALRALVDAGIHSPEIGAGFDLVFMDAAKGQYLNWLPMVLELMNPGGLLICDNVLQDLTVMESRFTVDRRDRTIHERMRAFLREIKNSDRLESSVISIGDGVSISVKIG